MKFHYTNMPGQAFIWNNGQTYFKPYTINPSRSIAINVELDWNRPYIAKNFGVSVWATKKAVTLKE